MDKDSGTLTVRTLRVPGAKYDQDANAPVLIPTDQILEALRPLLNTAVSKEPPTLTWMLPTAPSEEITSHINCQIMNPSDAMDGFLSATGLALLKPTQFSPITSALQISRTESARRKHQSFWKQLKLSVLLYLIGLCLVVFALRLALFRTQSAIGTLDHQLSSTRADGHRIAMALGQLKVIRPIEMSQQVFVSMLESLYQATPQGISYNLVELNANRHLRLRGQAESLSQPFLIPQALEATGVFKNITLRDASRGNRGSGSAIDFSIEAELATGAGI